MIDIWLGPKTRKRVIDNLIANSCLKDIEQIIERGKKYNWEKVTMERLHERREKLIQMRNGTS